MKSLRILSSLGLASAFAFGCHSPADVAARNDADNTDASSSQDTVSRSDSPAVTAPEISVADYTSFIADSNSFGLGLYQQVNSDLSLTDKNGIFSPVSAELALAMTYGGAVADTAAAMKTTLRDNLSPGLYHVACNRLRRDLLSRAYSRTDSYGYPWRIELAPANSLWMDRTFSVKTSFLDLLSQQYDTGLYRVDFANQPEPSRLAINAWVMDNTHDRIENLLQPEDVDASTRFVIVNALYFFGSWATPFDKTRTAPGSFHTLAGADVTVNMMHGMTQSLNYKSTPTAEVLQLPYTNGELWMTMVLPSSGQFEAVRSQISGAWLTDVTTGLNSTSVQLTLPKFKITTPQLKLKDSLTALGMGIAFTGPADFSGMTNEGFLISDVIQKAFIGVDEDGTEAAAATAVVGTFGLPPIPIALTFDRPFLFFIQDKSGIVLFAGQVVDPT